MLCQIEQIYFNIFPSGQHICKVIPVELEKLNRESITPRCVVFFMFLRADKMSFSDTIHSRDSAVFLSNLGMCDILMTSAILT